MGLIERWKARAVKDKIKKQLKGIESAPEDVKEKWKEKMIKMLFELQEEDLIEEITENGEPITEEEYMKVPWKEVMGDLKEALKEADENL